MFLEPFLGFLAFAFRRLTFGGAGAQQPRGVVQGLGHLQGFVQVVAGQIHGLSFGQGPGLGNQGLNGPGDPPGHGQGHAETEQGEQGRATDRPPEPGALFGP